MLPEKMTLNFRHLYDDRFAAFAKARYSWELPKIIFPSGFQPEIGRDYECIVNQTKTGRFTFENTIYHTCYAMLEAGNILHYMDFKYRGVGANKEGEATLGDILERVNLKEALPEKHELLDLQVQSDRKYGGWQFVPEYRGADEAAGGKPSMRIFKPVGKKVDLQPGRRYKARVEEVKNTGKMNARESVILEVRVFLL